jgi:hypothetical protein
LYGFQNQEKARKTGNIDQVHSIVESTDIPQKGQGTERDKQGIAAVCVPAAECDRLTCPAPKTPIISILISAKG